MKRFSFSVRSTFAFTAMIAVLIVLWLNSRPPTLADWGNFRADLDQKYAHKMFFGKSRKEGAELIAENSLSRQEDLGWMPTKCLHYYIHSYMDYLTSDLAANDADGASCFLSLVEGRSEDIRCGGSRLVSRVEKVLKHIENNQEWYDADVEIYGNFRTRAPQSRDALQRSD